jgi:hypothetical protein
MFFRNDGRVLMGYMALSLEDETLHNHRCEKPKTYISFSIQKEGLSVVFK